MRSMSEFGNIWQAGDIYRSIGVVIAFVIVVLIVIAIVIVIVIVIVFVIGVHERVWEYMAGRGYTGIRAARGDECGHQLRI